MVKILLDCAMMNVIMLMMVNVMTVVAILHKHSVNSAQTASIVDPD